jgi:hypothetical protein
MGKVLRSLTTFASAVLFFQEASAITRYVDASVPESADGSSWEAAFQTIQEGIDASSDGDTVTVAPGTYVGIIRLQGNDITLRSTDPLDPNVVSGTIIDGNGEGPVVSFEGGETPLCVLEGFTIQNGTRSGISGKDTHATIRFNVVFNNNSVAKAGGGGVISCDGLICSNTIAHNSAIYAGGGLIGCGGSIRNNVIAWNSAGTYGGGLARCGGLIENNTVADNSAVSWGGGLAACHGVIRNCIIWANTAPGSAQISGGSRPWYSCVLGWSESGGGNIFSNPRFADMDYRLSADSPCIDAGDNQEWMRDELDRDSNPRIWGGTVDMGAYEHGSWPFRIVEVTRLRGGQRQFMWNSRSGETYIVWSCSDLLLDLWDEEATVPSQGEITSWTDPDITSARKFYRIGYD